MGIQINGNTDTISAIDGALTVSGAELSAVTNLNATGIVTASQVNVGSAVTIHSGGFQVGSSDLHSTGINILNINTSNIIILGVTTATGGIIVGATTSITVGNTVIKSNSIGIGTTTTTGRNAGVGTARGSIIYNSTNSAIEAYGGDGWFNVKSIGISSSMTVFTSSGTFIVPEGVYRIKVTITGAGGGGYGGTYNRGGGAGGTAIKYINVTPRQGIGVTIGGGGSGANVNAIAGTSYFGSFCSATGGRNAGDGDYSDTASAPGVGVDGDWNFYGGSAQTHDGGIVAGSKGGDSFWGGGARGKPNGRYYGSSGIYGGGGGGGTYSAGNGGDGVCVVEWNL
jgi:hypothetical protein